MHASSVGDSRCGSPGPSPSANRRLLAEHEPGLAVGAERARITDRSALRRSKLASDARVIERRFLTPARRAVGCAVSGPTPTEASRSELLPLWPILTKADPHLSPLPQRPCSHGGPFPLWPLSYFSLFLLCPDETFSVRHDLASRCSYREALCVACQTQRIGRAPRADCGAHVGESSVRSPSKLVASCSMARAGHRRAHLQRATCHATRHPSCDVVGICIFHRFRM
jgi:hypothetical protein